MAMLDDPDWLLQHIKHSFITSDDTGMCEMVLQENDMMTLEQHKKRIQQLKGERRAERAKKNQKKGLPESFGRSTPVGTPTPVGTQRRSSPETDIISSAGTPTIGSINSEDGSPIAPSPDILSGWDFGVRRRSNTAQKLERIRKERQSRVKVNSVPWRKKNSKITEEQLSSMFEKKILEKRKSASDETLESNIKSHSPLVGDLSSSTKVIAPIMSVEASFTLPNNVTKQIGFQVEDCKTDIEIVETKKPSSRTYSAEETLCREQLDSVDSMKSDPSNEPFRRNRGMSALSKMLTQSTEQYDNPFREYSKFDGHGHGTAGVKKVNIFVWPYGAEKPRFSMLIEVLAQKAKVQDVIGLTCWKYSVDEQEPKLFGTTVQRYALHIAEDDGTVDTDFPHLDPNEPFSKFNFDMLSLVEKRPALSGEEGDAETGVKETVFVKVNDYEGSSLVQVDDLSVTMGEILKRTLKRRKGQSYTGKYVLEYQDRVGVAVDEDKTLESTGVMEFHLVREHSSRSNVPTNAFDGNVRRALTERLSPPPNDDVYRFPPISETETTAAHSASDGFIFVPTMEYVEYRFCQLRKLRPPAPVDFGVGPNQIDLVPVDRREGRSAISQLFSSRAKTLTIRVTMLAYCGIYDSKNRSNSLSVSPSSSGSFQSSLSSFANQDSGVSVKSCEKTVFKLYYKLSEYHTEFKHLALEGPSGEVEEAVDKVRTIMVLSGDRKLQAAFEARKFGASQSTTSSTNSTLKRRGSFFR